MKTLHRRLALTAGALAVVALLAGDRQRSGIDLDELARIVETERDHITAVELAQWIRDRKENLRLIDVRSATDFDAFHIPSAQHVPLSSITQLNSHPDDIIVLYSDGGTHAAQAWFFLQALGNRNVLFLRDGLNEWMDDIVSPVLPPHANASDRQQYARKRDLSQYFGGQADAFPQELGPARAKPATPDRIRALKRKTC